MDFWREIESAKKDQEEKNLNEFLKRRQRYSEVFGSDSGKWVLRDLLEQGHFFHTTYTGNALSYFKEGERNRLLQLCAPIPDIVGEVIQEWCREKTKEIIELQATRTEHGT